MNVFDLFAKLTLDTSDFDKQVENASNSFDDLGDAAAGIPGDTQKAEKAVDKFVQSIEDAKTESNQAETALNDAERALGDVGDEAKKAAPPLKKTSDGLKDVDKNSDNADDSLEKFGKTIIDSVTKGHLLAGAVETIISSITDFVASVWEMDESTEDFRVSMGKLDTAFETMGYSTTSARKTFREFYKLLGDPDTAVEASQLLAKLTSSMQEQSRWTEIAAGVYGTFGDSLPINGLIEAANETAKVGQVTGVLADALNWVGISEDDFNVRLASCADTQERTALITDTLASAYKDAATAMESNNSTIMKSREAQLKLQEAQAKVGEQISRLKTSFSNILSPSVEKVLSLVEKMTGKMADLAEEWENTANAIKNPLPTDSIEAARDQLDAWNDELARMKEELAGVTEATDADTFWRLSYQVDDLTGKINRGTEQLGEMEAAEASAAETANATADAVDKMTISANGFSVEIENSNATLEDATRWLETYTDAATNMFEEINTEYQGTYKQLLDTLEHNTVAFREWSANMELIAGELPGNLADVFYNAGPEVNAGLVAMLADQVRTGENGLADFREAYDEGGQAAFEALAHRLGDGDPMAELTYKLENDVTCEQAGQDLINRAANAVIKQVESAGFDTAGENAVNKFIAGMNLKKGEAEAAAGAIAASAAGAMIGATGGGSGGSKRAGGLDYVPYDGYPAILHRGESVLTKAEAEDWRRGSGGNAAGINIVQNIQSVPQTPVELAAATAAYFETARWAF